VRVRVGLFRTTIGGPSLEAKIPERPLFRLVLTRFPGRLLWRLRTEASVRKAVRTGFTRPAHIPEAFVQHALEMTPGLRGSDARAAELPPAAEPPRPAVTLRIPLLVIFGPDNQRCAPRWLPHIKPCPAPVSSCCRAWDTPQCWKTRKRPANC
jgi:hypothetical protein